MAVELRGEHVTLRPLIPEDVDGLLAAASESRETYQFTTVPEGRDEVVAYIDTAISQPDRVPFSIIYDDRVVGSTSYLNMTTWQWGEGSPMQRVDVPDIVEIGSTWLARSAQRTRCNTESKYLLLSHAFETWDVHRVSLRTDERNTRSRNAILRIGATFEGVLRSLERGSDGTIRNTVFFSIVRDEWPDVRAHLQTLLARQ